MTDKELRKLSRLELLELLLEESKENEQLRQALSKTSDVGEASPGAFADLEKVTARLEDVASRLDSIAMSTPKKSENEPSPSCAPPVYPPATTPYHAYTVPAPVKGVYEGDPKQSDAWLFHSIMHYFYKNEEMLLYLPEEISREIRIRLRGTR